MIINTLLVLGLLWVALGGITQVIAHARRRAYARWLAREHAALDTIERTAADYLRSIR